MAHAAGDALDQPIYGSHYLVTFPILDADGDLVSGATGLDSEVSKDLGTFADCTNEATEIATSSGTYYLYLTGAEMTAKIVTVIIKTTSSGAKTTTLSIHPNRLHVIATGTAQAGAAGTITLAAGTIKRTDDLAGMYVRLSNDTPSGVQYATRKIVSCVVSTQVATVDSNWGTNPSSSTTYEILAPVSATVTGQAGQLGLCNPIQSLIGLQIATSPRLTGVTVYGQVRTTASTIWNGSSFETYATANIANYDVAMTEQGTASGFYRGTFPTVSSAVYAVTVYLQAGAVPAENDLPIGAGLVEWDGSTVVPLSSRLAPTTAGRTLNVGTDSMAEVDVRKISTDATAADNLEAILDGTGAALTLTTLTTSSTVTFNAFTVTGATAFNGTVTATDAGNDIRGVRLSATGVDDVWDELQSGHVAAGSFGRYLDAQVSEVKAKTDSLAFTVAGRVDAQVFGMQANTVTAAALATDAVTEIANGLLDLADGVEAGFTVRQTFRVMGAALGGKTSGGPANSVFRNMGDSADRITSVTTSNGDRTTVTLTP